MINYQRFGEKSKKRKKKRKKKKASIQTIKNNAFSEETVKNRSQIFRLDYLDHATNSEGTMTKEK